MGKVVVLIGKMASGKDSISRLLERRGFDFLTSHTTRPIRKGELEGREYFFLSDSEFKEMEEDNHFIETRVYKTKGRNNEDLTWYYGLSWSQYELKKNNGLVILDLNGAKELADKVGSDNLFCVYLECPRDVRMERVLSRGDNELEVARRFEDDDMKFLSVKDFVDVTIDSNRPLGEVIEDILNNIGSDD